MRTWRSSLSVAVWLTLSAACFAAPRESKFLWISDIHFNPMADAGLVDALVKAEPAKWEAILSRTSPTSFSQYKSDVNWWLLQSALEAMPRTVRHPAFVMVTGDLLAHEFPQLYREATHDEDEQHYRAFVLKTVQFLGMELQEKFPGTRIYITPGNNDNDCGDYTIQAGGAFLNDTAAVAQRLANGDEAFARSWETLGSFNVAHPTVTNARIVSLNSIFWSQKYQALSSDQGCKPVSSTAGADLMTWLTEQLRAAAQAHEKVWLMFHIPPGIDGYASASKRQKLAAASSEHGAESNNPRGQQQAEWSTQGATCAQAIVPMWKVEWTEQFDALLEKYHDTVTAGFAAHTHSDDFRVIGAEGGQAEFVVMNPAISPIYGQNPAYRVASYHGNGTLADQTTYYLTNLPDASAKKKGRWKTEYTFTRQWKAKTLNAGSLGAVYEQVAKEERARAEWLRLYAVSGPALEGEKPIVRALYCAVEGLTVERYGTCWCNAKE